MIALIQTCTGCMCMYNLCVMLTNEYKHIHNTLKDH